VELSRFKCCFVGAAVSGFAALAATATAAAASPLAQQCATGAAALRGMLETEYAFGREARTSVRAAFLEYLAEDSLVLQPGPVSGRAFYTAAKDSADTLQWYPVSAGSADSGDLGFTTGPWIYTLAAKNMPLHGHYLTIWKREASCQWRAEFDGGISHARPTSVEPKLMPEEASYAKGSGPPPKFIAEDAAGHAIRDFQGTLRQDGFPSALRTYARVRDFVFYTDGEAPMKLAGANRYLTDHSILGAWKESGRGRSADSTLAYTVGELGDATQHSNHAYVQIWQYDPRVANWGLRVLLINPLPPMSN